MDDALLIELLIDLQVEVKAIHDCLRLNVQVPLLTIQGRREDAELERESFRDEAVKQLARLRSRA
jgi:hypothetical protein